MPRGQKTEWTKKELDTLKEMREEGYSYKKISKKLKRISATSIAEKCYQLNIKVKKNDKIEKIEIAKKKKEDEPLKGLIPIIPKIGIITPLKKVPSKSFDGSFSPVAMDKKTRKTLEELHSKGPLTALRKKPERETKEEAYTRLGWKRTMDPLQVLNMRNRVEKAAGKLLNVSVIDRKNPHHMTTLLVIAANSLKKSIVDISIITLLPLEAVEKIFNAFNKEKLWPSSNENSDTKTNKTYKEMVAITENYLKN